MSNDNRRAAKEASISEFGDIETADYVTFEIENQLFGIAVLEVQDVLRHQPIARIPLAPPQVAGSLNLRGRIVTAINVRRRMGLEEHGPMDQQTSLVVDQDGELYSLLVDKVGDVVTMPVKDFEKNPATLDPLWRAVSSGIYQLEGRLLVVMDVEQLLDFTVEAAA